MISVSGLIENTLLRFNRVMYSDLGNNYFKYLVDSPLTL